MNNKKPQFANIVFFIRGVEPREPIDLAGTMSKQLDLVNLYDFPATFLMQYDAMINPDFERVIKEKINDKSEIGGWFEIVQPMVEKAGLKWRGREGFAWDWHADVGFSVGYSPDERKKLVDIYMEEFKTIFGTYPSSVGSWVIDAVSLNYMNEKYGVSASCICRDQWGTDGYTLWGGHFAHGYYPSKNNMLCPAGTEAEQIPVPTFRMLGSDPIYQYDLGLFDEGEEMKPSEDQKVVTLEPVYSGFGGGGDPDWIDWYFKENFKQSVSYGYTQIGQENSFGWELMKDGLLFQFSALYKLQKAGKVTVCNLGEVGKWFKENYALTPCTSVSGLTDWQESGHKSLWYESRFFRVNFYEENNKLWIRDIHKFDEQYKEIYINDTAKTHKLTYDNLPVIDGNRWSAGRIRSGIYPALLDSSGNSQNVTGAFTVSYPSDDTALIGFKGESGTLNITCTETGIRFEYTGMGQLALDFVDGIGKLSDVKISDSALSYIHNGYGYQVQIKGGKVSRLTNGLRIISDNNVLEITL